MTAGLVAIAAGAVAGLALGFALQRSDLCFHSAFAGVWGGGRSEPMRGYLLTVALAAVGLSVVYAWGPWDQLNRGLGFRPVPVVTGGLTIGVGMVVAASCTSGLFYKLGSGMVGALVGLAGWAFGELVARDVRLPGPTVLPGGEEGTIPGVLGVTPLVVAVPLLGVTILFLLRHPSPRQESEGSKRDAGGADRWAWPMIGIGVGLATVVGWMMAGVGGATFGPSTTGTVSGVANGSPDRWQIAFLVAIVAGSAFAARTRGGWWVRGETPRRLGGLFVGGTLMGAGAIIAGGCNLGHGLSGMAQMNVSSLVAVASMIAGVGLARRARRLVSTGSPVR